MTENKEYKAYLTWLKAAYLYYINYGEDSGMSDAEWDHLSREFYANREQFSPEEYPVLHRSEFIGGSLFWLKKNEYPKEIFSL